MQIIMELFLIKKSEVVSTVKEAYCMIILAAAFSYTIFNFANYAEIKWLAILAVIDLAYFGLKMCMFGIVMYVLYVLYASAGSVKELFQSKWEPVFNDTLEILIEAFK